MSQNTPPEEKLEALKDTPPKTHEEKIDALENVYAAQTAKAISSNKIRGVATMEKICELAQVDKKHVYGHTTCPEEIAKKYAAFKERVQRFNADFVTRKKTIIEHGVSDEIKLQDAQEDNHALKAEVVGLEARVRLVQIKNQQLLAKNTLLQSIADCDITQDEKISPLFDITISTICPDDHLEKDGRYNFHNPKEREKAWNNARTEFARLMKRKVPQRVYLLMGPPCAGKSIWAKSKNIRPDRHAVIIDATNLTAGERAIWIMQSLKASNIKICVVRFIVNFTTIAARNTQRSHKMIDSDVLKEKFEQLQEVNPEFEEVDEIIFVRSGDE
tara:strand:- start:20916 stop:21905 length:990 start_codon:yes stop_codon:yes gene_type:complete